MKQNPKKKIAIFSGTGCRACENAILDINYQVLTLSPWAEVVYWPYLLGSEESCLDVAEDIDVCFFSGAVRTEEERVMAERLRLKSELVVACGACAAFGGLPALIDLGRINDEPGPREGHASGRDPGPLDLQEPGPQVLALEQVVPVDYVVPGCPPTQSVLWAALQALVCGPQALARISFANTVFSPEVAQAVFGAVLPPKGSVFAGGKAVCAGCSRAKEEKKIHGPLRGSSLDAAADRCLLEQGILCVGIVTREGCGGICTSAGMPCRGCFGKLPSIADPGAKAVAAIGATFESMDVSEMERWIAGLQDMSGTFYRYTYATQCTLKPPTPHETGGGA
jgi:F420-non-reducing hydrogenase small subunit